MSDGLKVDNVELLTDEFSEDALAHGGAPGQVAYSDGSARRGGSHMLTRMIVAVLLLVCGALSYPAALHFGIIKGSSDASQEPVIVGIHAAGAEQKPVNVITGAESSKTMGRMASAEDSLVSREKVSAIRDGNEQLVPRGSNTDATQATNVKFDRVAANYKPRTNGTGVEVEQPGAATNTSSPKLNGASAGTKVAVPLSQGRLLRFDDEVESVFIADPNIADVKVLSTNEIYVFGKKMGVTTLQAVSNNKKDSGETGLSASVQLYVGYDPEQVVDAKETVARSAPLKFSYQNERAVVQGHARNVEEALAGHETAKNFGNGREPLDIATMNGPNQVNLRVRFAEINRSQLQALGIDWGFNVQAGSFSLGVSKTSSINSGGNLNLKGSSGNFTSINLAIEALQKNGMVNILAEPNLTAVTGETASFLAGGEVPIPVVTGSALNNNNIPQVSVAYKTFGVSLQFTPTIIRKDRIAMRVRPEVSSIAGTADFGVNGVAMPTFTVRRTDTVVEVASGQTFAIAGLFQRDISRNIEKFPLLGDIPVLGALFQSENFKRNETELVILITPYLVEPVSDKMLATPADKRTDQNTAMRPVRSEVEQPRPAPKQVDPGKSGFIYK